MVTICIWWYENVTINMDLFKMKWDKQLSMLVWNCACYFMFYLFQWIKKETERWWVHHCSLVNLITGDSLQTGILTMYFSLSKQLHTIGGVYNATEERAAANPWQRNWSVKSAKGWSNLTSVWLSDLVKPTSF